MKIVVNETTYNDATWSFNHERGTAALLLKTDDSIGTIAANFDGDDTIRAYDDSDNETGVWYVTQLLSVTENWESHTPDEPREVIVSIKATSLSTEAEQALGDSIDENMEAILELGGLIADMEEAHTRMNNLEARLDRLPANVQAQIDELNNRYNALADRVAALENEREGS